jgi:hypothetical protein
MKRLEEIIGEERTKLDAKYLRAYRKSFKYKSGGFSGEDLVKFRQDFMRKNKIETGV